MSIATWHPPAQLVPSASRHGERSAAPLYSAAGRALSEWEQTEAATVKLFQILCETSSAAACKAYCTVSGAPGRSAAMAAAGEEFFQRRRVRGKVAIEMHERTLAVLLNAYEVAGTYRSNIVHGVAAQPHDNGHFLCAPSYAGKKRQAGRIHSQSRSSAQAYCYKVEDIDHFTKRFIAIRDEAMRLAVALNVARRELRHSHDHALQRPSASAQP